jgi:hypothetical protein
MVKIVKCCVLFWHKFVALDYMSWVSVLLLVIICPLHCNERLTTCIMSWSETSFSRLTEFGVRWHACSNYDRIYESRLEYVYLIALCNFVVVSRDSAVGIETGYVLDNQGVGVQVPVGGQEFSLLYVVQTGSGARPASYPMGVPGALSPGVKRPWREADRSPPTSAEVKKTWVYTSTPPYVFMGVVLN